MEDHQKPFFAELIMAYNLAGEREALQLLREFWSDVVTCTAGKQGLPPGIKRVMDVIEAETNAAWAEGR